MSKVGAKFMVVNKGGGRLLIIYHAPQLLQKLMLIKEDL